MIVVVVTDTEYFFFDFCYSVNEVRELRGGCLSFGYLLFDRGEFYRRFNTSVFVFLRVFSF